MYKHVWIKALVKAEEITACLAQKPNKPSHFSLFA